MRAYLRELCSLAAVGLFMVGFVALSAIVVEGRDVAHGVALAEARP
ncbi:hypothetical protein [Aureimonas phyllosphaerae]|uniref:Uncharacterized protein n=1 Tax=Aureimonas phyllosphaerae TaxID=1166078 RepID=A0A7W6BTU1_9HYPH|nr:hypothetical protein [Aureimonas phyllosphaerae]MBB3937909.1 hypothetical protein [Aureimonas phyllosphaerae]MBB3961918.1 hypothetical protein [Aureimonas phyllosphaerae]SFF54688.1 hypothetical protein SAMN05216566_12545 [Aureimonas phyllosphaerae]